MKRWLLASAVTAMTYGGLALAGNEGSSPVAQNDQGTPGYVQVPPPPPPAPSVYQSPTAGHMGSIMAGAGLDGYMGATGALVRPGFAWGATLLGQPSRAFGIEANYSGSVSEISNTAAGFNVNPVTGADIVRNGVSALLSLGPPWKVQPYLMAGYGINWYTARGATTLAGFHSDTGGAFPFGAGLRTKAGHFTADLRWDYNLGIGETFAPTGHANADRYQALLQLGGNF